MRDGAQHIAAQTLARDLRLRLLLPAVERFALEYNGELREDGVQELRLVLRQRAAVQRRDPAYPALSRRLGEEGKVLLKVRVSAQGSALEVAVSKSSGFPRLDAAGVDAVTRWRFVPARRGDEAIESSVVVPITFALD